MPVKYKKSLQDKFNPVIFENTAKISLFVYM